MCGMKIGWIENFWEKKSNVWQDSGLCKGQHPVN